MAASDTTLNVKVVPELDKEALLAAILEVISSHAVVKPGETLVIRLKDWNADQVDCYQQDLDSRGLPFRVLAVLGDELAVAKAQSDSLDDLPGLPSFAVAEIEWPDDREEPRQKFGPWIIGPDDSYLAAIGGFVDGLSRARGTKAARITLTTGDESVAEGATYPGLL